jgi:hypothetical protein
MNWNALSCLSSDLYKAQASATCIHQHPRDTSFMSYKNKIHDLNLDNAKCVPCLSLEYHCEVLTQSMIDTHKICSHIFVWSFIGAYGTICLAVCIWKYSLIRD